MDDIVERLRCWLSDNPACMEAADEIVKLREALGEIANRAGNFMDADAADWMPSIYKISCEAIGSDPWPMLEANGWKREELTASDTNGVRSPE